MKAFRLSLVTILLVAVVLPSVMGTFGPFKGGRNPMHAMMKHIMRMPKMIANTFHKGMRGKHIWLGGCPNPSKFEQCWEYALNLYTHVKTK